MNSGNTHKIHFLGIGGIGMSALARYCRLMGREVSGYDRTASVVTDALEKEGVKVYFEADVRHLEGAEMVVYTPAVPADHAELVQARASGVPLLKRSQVLGAIGKSYQTLAVAGTHGKSTTSAMLTHLLRGAGVDATAFLGAISRNLESNFVFGHSPYMVAEADEYDRSFLTLHPWMAVINSMDPDHLEIYGDEAGMKAGFLQFASQCERLLVHVSLAEEFTGREVMTFGIEQGDYHASHLRYEGLRTRFDFQGKGIIIKDIAVNMPGVHNVLNMSAALGVAVEAGADVSLLKAAAESFAGLYRRFEVHCHSERLTYIDDYAHHPAEIAAAIGAARALFPERKLVVVFQPHLFTRTRDLCSGFAEELAQADTLLLMDIYPARELPIEGVSAQMLLDAMPAGDFSLVSRAALTDEITLKLDRPTVLMTLGAGDIDREIERIKTCFC
ncbi:MAG: UDP-N-acetylmuramate--L-alanine ligase [Bacteroidetes bacterium]|nr:MAG: UDP-N-acetylmuramate--L-alanine ligase [Bacteroidota bacterium]